MTIHFTSDTHFWHKNIIKYCPETRGHFNSVEDMNTYLKDAWNSHVCKKDTVYHLGDFAFASHQVVRKMLENLEGDIYILKGNHDKVFQASFQNLLETVGIVKKFIPACHEIKAEGHRIILNHYAQRVWNGSHYGAIHLYGHSHGTLPGVGKSVDVGVDSIEMSKFTGGALRPWSLEEVLLYMENRPVYWPDHHNEDTN